MLLFAHLGITLGAVYILFKLLRKNFDSRILTITSLGALLPDIIDKPIGQILFYDTFHNNRIFAHTLLFILILTALGLYLRRNGEDRMLLVAFCSSIHLILDEMWNRPKTLFWPTLGWRFEEVNLENYVSDTLSSLTHNPHTYIPEITGLLISIFILSKLFITTTKVKGGIPLEYNRNKTEDQSRDTNDE